MHLISRRTFDNDQDCALYNRIAWHLLPFLFVLCVLAFLDRVNVVCRPTCRSVALATLEALGGRHTAVVALHWGCSRRNNPTAMPWPFRKGDRANRKPVS